MTKEGKERNYVEEINQKKKKKEVLHSRLLSRPPLTKQSGDDGFTQPTLQSHIPLQERRGEPDREQNEPTATLLNGGSTFHFTSADRKGS